MITKTFLESKNEIKWCPGCGNYAILSTIYKTMNMLNLKNDEIIFISGIGCSGRFPYYTNTYGFHTIHGRSTAIASGFKIVRPDLTVFVIIGDGDGFSIGLNHTLRLIRRNINVKLIFVNNKIYALTKGQYSPTSDKNFITKSSPHGSIEKSINPLLLVLAVGGTFIARSMDNDSKTLQEILIEALKHKGTAFIEILQNCNVFNDGIYSDFYFKNENLIYIKNKEPIIFNNEKKTIIIKNNKLKIIDCEKINKKKILIYENDNDNILQFLLIKNGYKKPLPVGILKKKKENCYENILQKKNINGKNIKEYLDIFK